MALLRDARNVLNIRMGSLLLKEMACGCKIEKKKKGFANTFVVLVPESSMIPDYTSSRSGRFINSATASRADLPA